MKPKPRIVDRMLDSKTVHSLQRPKRLWALLPALISHRANIWQVNSNIIHFPSGEMRKEDIPTNMHTVATNAMGTQGNFFSLGLGHLSAKNGTRYKTSAWVAARVAVRVAVHNYLFIFLSF